MAIDYKSSISRYSKYLLAMQKRPLWQASLILALSLGLIIILLVLVLRPTLITISSLLGQIKTQSSIEKKLDAKITALQQAQQLLNQVQPQLTYLDASLPTQAMMGSWTQAVEIIASASGVSLTQVSLSDVSLSATSSANEAVVPITFSISATSTYSQLVDFVNTLEKLPRLAILRSVQFTRTQDGSLQLAIQGTIGFAYSSPKNI